MPYSNRTKQHSLRWVGAIALVMGVAACGGGGDDPSPTQPSPAPVDPGSPTVPAPTPTPPVEPAPQPTPEPNPPEEPGPSPEPVPPVEPPPVAETQLFGTAAVGAPIAGGLVEVRCDGASTVLSTTTAPTGTWQVNTTGQTLPCAVRVTGGSLGAGQAYHSIAMTFGNTNITPLTDLLIANATGQLPSAWWLSVLPKTPTQAELDGALTLLRKAFDLSVLQTLNPLTAPFTATPKDSIDDVLEALQLTLQQIRMDYATLLSSAVSNGLTLSQSWRTALASAYVTITTGESNVPGTGGSHTLVLNVTASGMTMPAITLTDIPKPGSQNEFCGFVNDPSSPLSLNQATNGAQGKVTIQSCSFNGTVGQVSALLQITSPISMSVPYDVRYTYN